MTALIVTVFIASLLGSLHCAGMCGAFVAFAVAAPDDRTPKWLLHAAYNGGRLVTYVTLGGLAGLLGSVVDMGGSLVGVQQVAAALAAATVATFGIVCLLRVKGVRVARIRPPKSMEMALHAGHRRAMQLAPPSRALAIGLLTTLLPCGWLYAFVATAAGTANPLFGAVTMAVFWAGTLPILVALGAGVRAFTGRFGKSMPILMPVMITLVAMLSIVSRAWMPVHLDQDATSKSATLSDVVEHVHGLDHREMLCCNPEDTVGG